MMMVLAGAILLAALVATLDFAINKFVYNRAGFKGVFLLAAVGAAVGLAVQYFLFSGSDDESEPSKNGQVPQGEREDTEIIEQ